MLMYEGKYSFNIEWVASKTFAEFKEHEKHHGLDDKKMKEVYDLCKEMTKKK